MCKIASFVFRPTEQMEFKTYRLDSHAETQKHFGLLDSGRDGWREGHYLPDGTIECRILEGDTLTSTQCAAWVRAQWPTFVDFFNSHRPDKWEGILDLRGLTSAAGLKLPEKIGGELDLRGLTSAAREKIRQQTGK